MIRYCIQHSSKLCVHYVFLFLPPHVCTFCKFVWLAQAVCTIQPSNKYQRCQCDGVSAQNVCEHKVDVCPCVLSF